MMEFYLIFFMVAHSVRGSRELRTPLTLYFIVMLIVCIYGMHSIGTTPRVSARQFAISCSISWMLGQSRA